jgi:hypothetical protein
VFVCVYVLCMENLSLVNIIRDQPQNLLSLLEIFGFVLFSNVYKWSWLYYANRGFVGISVKFAKIFLFRFWYSSSFFYFKHELESVLVPASRRKVFFCEKSPQEKWKIIISSAKFSFPLSSSTAKLKSIELNDLS